jgi:hypothetical protein
MNAAALSLDEVAVRNVLIDKKQEDNDGNGLTKNENKM